MTTPRLAATIYHAPGVMYGPGLGNADRVPAEVAASHLDPVLWVDGNMPEVHGNVAPIPADAETVLEDLGDPYEGAPTYQEAARQHVAAHAVDVTGLSRNELRALCDGHGLEWVHRDTKADLVHRLRVAGFAQ